MTTEWLSKLQRSITYFKEYTDSDSSIDVDDITIAAVILKYITDGIHTESFDTIRSSYQRDGILLDIDKTYQNVLYHIKHEFDGIYYNFSEHYIPYTSEYGYKYEDGVEYEDIYDEIVPKYNSDNFIKLIKDSKHKYPDLHITNFRKYEYELLDAYFQKYLNWSKYFARYDNFGLPFPEHIINHIIFYLQLSQS